MPKNSRDFPSTLNFGVDLQTKQELVAYGYFMGQGGEYASGARNFIQGHYRQWYGGLTDKQRKEFDEILANVKIRITK